jgi:hypothetical protein
LRYSLFHAANSRTAFLRLSIITICGFTNQYLNERRYMILLGALFEVAPRRRIAMRIREGGVNP